MKHMTSNIQQAFKANAKEVTKISESIKKNAPNNTYEMPGPLGSSVRKEAAQVTFQKEYQNNNTDRAKNFIEKNKSEPVISKENVREGTKGLLGPTFNNKARGLEK